MTPHIELRTGDRLPVVGLGTWKVPKEVCAQVIQDAVAAGYRHFDCACDYGNEAEVGSGLHQVLSSGGCRREDLWITSKLWNTYHRRLHVPLACKKSLSDLKLDYLDLYLIHFPIVQHFVPIEERYPPGWFYKPDAISPKLEFDEVPILETWEAIVELKRAGLVRNIGVSNFGTGLLRDLMNSGSEPPAVLQVESHPYLTQEKLLRFAHEQQIACTAFSPLGALSYHAIGMADLSDSFLKHETIRQIAAEHGKTAAQILIRWGVQRGTAVIPKTANRARLAENIAITQFELSAEQMVTISGLNQNRRYNDPGAFCETAFNTFCPIYE